jgi:hypothetical protein
MNEILRLRSPIEHSHPTDLTGRIRFRRWPLYTLVKVLHHLGRMVSLLSPLQCWRKGVRPNESIGWMVMSPSLHQLRPALETA